MIQNFIYVVEGVFFVHDCVEENSKRPDVLLFAAVCFALEDLGCGVV